jgi:hypothetical protein
LLYRGLARAAFGCLSNIPFSLLSLLSLSLLSRAEWRTRLMRRTRLYFAVNHNRRYAGAEDEGLLDLLTRISHLCIVPSPTAERLAELEHRLQGDPASSDCQRWLTPEEFADGFGESSDDIAKITQWLKAQGFTVHQTARA